MTSARQVKRISSLFPCNQVGNITIRCNDTNRVIGINNDIILCTHTEYQIIKLLSAGQPISDSALSNELFHCSPDNTMLKNLSKHIEHLREKLRGTGVDIHRIHAYGYILVEENSQLTCNPTQNLSPTEGKDYRLSPE